MRDVLVAVSVGLIVWVGFMIFNRNASWQGFYETPSSGRTLLSQKYKSPEECRSWMSSVRQTNPEAFNIECGSNCEAPTTLDGPYVCEDTFDQ